MTVPSPTTVRQAAVLVALEGAAGLVAAVVYVVSGFGGANEPGLNKFGNTIAVAALVLALAYVSFEIRRLYHGPVLTGGVTSDAEQYTYSIAWLIFGVLLLGIGIAFNSQRARLASAAVIALTIAKVFLIDLSTLTGVYRALSFIGLGLVLVAIGYFYQRILFRRQTAPQSAAPPS